MAARREKKGAPSKDRRPAKKKTSILDTDSIKWIDYKDVNLLRRFMSERAKIRARRVTGNDQQQQAAVARAIKVAREMALLPYSVRQVTQRSKGRRDRDRDRNGGPRGERPPMAVEGGLETAAQERIQAAAPVEAVAPAEAAPEATAVAAAAEAPVEEAAAIESTAGAQPPTATEAEAPTPSVSSSEEMTGEPPEGTVTGSQ